MKPLSRKKRYVYFVLAAIVFVICVPLLILYASGYRFSEFGLASTGGLYISAPQSGVEINIDGKFVKRTSVFQKSVFVQNLKPSVYDIHMYKEGFQEWKKRLEVFPETVTEAHSFFLPVESPVDEILATISLDEASGTSTASLVENPLYETVSELFVTEKAKVSKGVQATTTSNIKSSRRLVISEDEGMLTVVWTGNSDSKPSYFCQDGDCKESIEIITPSKVEAFDFLPGRDDLILLDLDTGIYVSEIDNRSEQNIQYILIGEGIDFRINNSNIYLKKGKTLYSVSL